jgi:hypothetical protein
MEMTPDHEIWLFNLPQPPPPKTKQSKTKREEREHFTIYKEKF